MQVIQNIQNIEVQNMLSVVIPSKISRTKQSEMVVMQLLLK